MREASNLTISHSILVASGKGGVGKTTTAAQLAGLAAAGGWRTLAVDGDNPPALSREFGYIPDGGKAFADAIRNGAALTPIADKTRPNLWHIAGGVALDDAVTDISLRIMKGSFDAIGSLERALTPIAGDFDLIVFDSPPRELLLRRMLLHAAHYLVVPTAPDAASIDGIADMLETVGELRRTSNPDIDLLGVVVLPVPAQAKTLRAGARTEIDSLLGKGMTFDTMIRYVPAVAKTCRDLGLLATEYEAAALNDKSTRSPWFKLDKSERAAQTQWSNAATPLAAEWQGLIEEVLGRFSQRQAAA